MPHAVHRTTVAIFALLFVGVAATPAAELDLSTPAMQQLKRDYDLARKQLDGACAKQREALVSKQLKAMKSLLTEKIQAGNISGMAVGRKGVSLYETCLQQLKDTGDFELPENVRRELSSSVDECRSGKQATDDEYAAALAQLDARHREQLVKLGATQGSTDISVDEIASFFTRLMEGEEAAPPAPEGAIPAVPRETEAKPGEEDGDAAAVPDEPAKVIASSGEGGIWVAVARLFLGVSGIELVEIPVIEREQREHKEVPPASPLSQPYELTYEPIRRLSPGPGYSFELKSLPGREIPEVVEWPSARNQWTLQLRLRPTREVPSRHGAELLVSFAGSEALPLLHGEDAEDEEQNAELVQIDIQTQPEGAYVYVDGRPFRKGNEFLKTPCAVPVRAGIRNIRLRLFGYIDAVIPEFDTAVNKEIKWRLEKDTRAADESVQVSARSRWQSTRVDVERGDKLYLKATGVWKCGSGGEMVDAEGYSNDKQFYKYYLNPRAGPRQLAGVSYGALIMRIGKDGPMQKVGKSAVITADRAGAVSLDINEDEDVRTRRDNGGTLTVRVRKVPGLAAAE